MVEHFLKPNKRAQGLKETGWVEIFSNLDNRLDFASHLNFKHNKKLGFLRYVGSNRNTASENNKLGRRIRMPSVDSLQQSNKREGGSCI